MHLSSQRRGAGLSQKATIFLGGQFLAVFLSNQTFPGFGLHSLSIGAREKLVAVKNTRLQYYQIIFCCCKSSLNFYKRASGLALNQTKRFYLLTIFSHFLSENLSSWGLCFVFVPPYNIAPKCTFTKMRVVRPGKLHPTHVFQQKNASLIFYYFHHATIIRRPARFKGSKGMS